MPNPLSIHQDEYLRSIQNREQYWSEQAESLFWYKKWDQVLDQSNRPFFKWFTGGRINCAANALDRHCDSERKNKTALIWENELGQSRSYTYLQLRQAVDRMAFALVSLGIKKGDAVTLYLPLTPELPMAMLACAKIGAIHSVVYAGFSVDALASRMEDCQSKLLITADGSWRRGKAIPLWDVARQALDKSPSVSKSIVLRHNQAPISLKAGRDHWLHELLAGTPNDRPFPTAELEAEDPLFILYTSGTTGKPKGLLHTHGGYALYTSFTHKRVFDLQENDRFWCTADPGWITGHSYVVYGPLINGSTVFIYEGAPTHPHPDQWWKLIEKHQISIFYTSPTAIRAFMKQGEQWAEPYAMPSLRLLGSVGEPINPEAWKWFHHFIGKDRCPIMDTWWQTETGGFMISPLPDTKLKPGSATLPLFGNTIAVVDDQGTPVPANQEGHLVIQNPWPGMARTIFGDPDRYRETYWKTFEKQGWYKTGDAARIDDDGYTWIIGRTDDVIKVSGYRLGTAEVESALVSHPCVAEAAVIGLPHDIKGHGIHAFVQLRQSATPSEHLANQIKEHVAKEIGPIARPEEVYIVPSLPKTRSGKIMRRVLRAKAQGQDTGDLSTLEED